MGRDDGVEGGIDKVSVEWVEELKGFMEVVVVCMDGDDGVPNDDVSMPRWGLEEELVGEEEGKAGVVQAEEGGGDEGIMKEGDLGGKKLFTKKANEFLWINQQSEFKVIE